MPGWTCPQCRRLFRRAGQSHECAPAMSLEEYFSTGPPHERPVFEAVMAHLRGPDDLDDRLRSWLTEAYGESPP